MMIDDNDNMLGWDKILVTLVIIILMKLIIKLGIITLGMIIGICFSYEINDIKV